MSNTEFPDISALELSQKEVNFLKEFEAKTEKFNSELERIASEIYQHQNQEKLLEQTKKSIHTILSACREFDQFFASRPDLSKHARQEFREKTNKYFEQSFFMNRARTWPQGYPGDYKTLEYTYGNAPLSKGIGLLLDQYFLSTALAVAVRKRLTTLCDILRKEIVARPGAKVLNVASGSCRELFDIAPEFNQAGASAICIDFDKDALQFSSERLSCTGIPAGRIAFRKYNAVKMVNRDRNLKEFGPQDIIYSTGFYDYIADEILVSLLDASYDLLRPGGVLIASFKDSRKYETQDYHWLVKWDAFLQRNEEQTDALFSRSILSTGTIRKFREQSGVIHFYVVTKSQ